MYLPREPYLPEIKMGPRVSNTCLVSFGPLVCTALSASKFKNINCILGHLRKARFISSLGLKDGYWQIHLEETSR